MVGGIYPLSSRMPDFQLLFLFVITTAAILHAFSIIQENSMNNYSKLIIITILFLHPFSTLAVEKKQLGKLKKLYQHFHSNPELSFHEKNTSKRLANELKALGYTVTEGVGGYGVVAQFYNGTGPTLMIRADTDGLPVPEQTGLSYASKIVTKDENGIDVPVMHACGHDIHMTVLVGTAAEMMNKKDQWSGTLLLIGQPAEEKGGGAKAMLEDGLFERFPRPDHNLALHDSASLPAGSVGYTSGYALANVDSVDIEVYGQGGHGAYPHTTKDPIILASQLVLALQTIVSREINPVEPAVVTVGSIHGGTKHNIISDKVTLQLTLRSYSLKVREQTINTIKRISTGLAQAAGLPEAKWPKVTVKDEFTPSTYNDPEFTTKAVGWIKDAIGKNNVLEIPAVMGGEDFGRFGSVSPNIPSFIFWLGAIDPALYEKAKKSGSKLPSLHSPFFAPLPGPTLETGVESMSAVALKLLAK